MIWHHWHSELWRRQWAALQKFGIKVITDVTEEPITTADAKTHLRIVGTTEDAWLATAVGVAREYCEGYLGRALATRTLELSSDRFPIIGIQGHVGPQINLPFGPVQSVQSISYISPNPDSSGNYATETFDGFEVDQYVTPNRLVLAFGQTWPAARSSVNSVKIRYVTGYIAAADSAGNAVLPKAARHAMLLMLGHLYENREATATQATLGLELPLGVAALLDMVPDRENLGMA